MKTIVITSWYFNPIHPGHIECLEMCKELGDELRVIVNNDEQVKIKTGKEEVFQDQNFRAKIVSSLKSVDRIIFSIEDSSYSNQTSLFQPIVDSIIYVVDLIRQKYWTDTKIIFGKGWDRWSTNTPEADICKKLWVEIIYWLWAKTHNSSTYRAKS